MFHPSQAWRPALMVVLAVLAAGCAAPAVEPTASAGSPSVPAAIAATPPTGTDPSSAPQLPTPTSRPLNSYVIAAGDTLSKVARHFGVTIDQLLAANPSIENADAISIGQTISVPVVAWHPLDIESALRGGEFNSADKHVVLSQEVTVRVAADRSMAGEQVDWYTSNELGVPQHWTHLGSDSLDADGMNSYTEALPEHDRVSWQARLAATAVHAVLWSDSIVVEWGGSGRCPADRTGTELLGTSPDGTVYKSVSSVDADWNGRTAIAATDLRGVPGAGWSFDLGICRVPYAPVFAADGTAFISVLGLPYTPYALDAVVLVFGADGPTPRASIPTTGSYGSRGPGLFASPDGTVYMFTYDGEYDENTYRSLTLTALDSRGKPHVGWPFETTDRGSDPAFGPDGTVYLALWTDGPDRIVALDPTGQIKPGWPFVFPADFRLPGRCSGADMCPADVERPVRPDVGVDGSLSVTGLGRTITIAPDGSVLPD